MLGLIPNFLSRLRKKRHWCDFFSTASVWADHVRSSVMWTPRNLKLFTRSTGVLSMEMGVCSLLCLLKSTTSSLVLSMLSERWFSWHHSPLCRPSHRCQWSGLSPLCRQRIWQWHWSCVWLYSHVCTGSTGVGWERSPAEHQCWGSAEMKCCNPPLP